MCFNKTVELANSSFQKHVSENNRNSVYYHRREVAQPCVNGDRLSKGRMAKFDLSQIRNPSTDRHKI